MASLGKLIRLNDIRQIWPDEARNFTPWLAQSENLSILSNELGFGEDGLEVEGVEKNVGPFRADILCRDVSNPEGGRVLIENQYGKTDHDHLGKLLTYGAGLKARTVILCAEDIREEHRAALVWLNDMTDDSHRFFGITLELWQIGDSLPAPRFNIAVAPNAWSRQVEAVVNRGELTPLREAYLRFWTGLADYITNQTTELQPRKALPQHWTGFSIGRTNFELNAGASEQKNLISVELRIYGPEAKGCLTLLRSDAETFEQECGFQLEWDFMEGREGARIMVKKDNVSILEEARWPEWHRWLFEKLDRLHRVFKDPVRQLELDSARLI